MAAAEGRFSAPPPPVMPMKSAGSGHDLAALRVMKDEGLTFCILKCLSLGEAGLLWRVQRLFLQVLQGKVVPLLALYERNWQVVGMYMRIPGEPHSKGYPRFEYNLEAMCVESMLRLDFEGLRLLAARGYDFRAVQANPRIAAFAREAMREGSLEQLSALRGIGYDYSALLAEAAAAGELSESLRLDRAVTIDFFGTRLTCRSPALEFTGQGYVEQQLASLCAIRGFPVDGLFRVPFALAAFIRAGASTACLMRPEGCGYLLLLALASESFTFVYLLVKDAIHLEAVFAQYRQQLLRLVHRALEHRRFMVLDLLAFCGYSLERSGDEVQSQFDERFLKCLLTEDLAPIERMSRLGLSLRRLAERNEGAFHVFVQRRLEAMQVGRPGDASCQAPAPEPATDLAAAGPTEEAPPQPQAEGAASARELLRRLARLDRSALELHFRSRVFLDFAGGLLAKRSFVSLRSIVEVHPGALEVCFVENRATLEGSIIDAFLLRDVAFVVDMCSLSFPMGSFFARHQAEVDSMLLSCWLQHKSWAELGALRSEVRQWNFPAFFERNRGRTDDFAIVTIENGYWYDVNNLAQLGFDFRSFFDRRFEEVSRAVLGFIETSRPHFVLLRELSALSFPWARFMEAHRHRLGPAKDDDFLHFVISLEGFEIGSKVYGVVEQTCRLYHSMASQLFPSPAEMSQRPLPDDEGGAEEAEASAEERSPPGLGARALAAASPSSASSSPASREGEEARTKRHRPAAVAEAAVWEAPAAAALAAEDAIAAFTSLSSASSAASPGERGIEGEAAAEAAADAAAEAALLLRTRALDLVAQARERKLDAKKVLMLMVCKGAYCWNPLSEECSDGKGGSVSAAAVAEGVLGFLESHDESFAEQVVSAYNNIFLPHHLQAFSAAAAAATATSATATATATAMGRGLAPISAAAAAAAHIAARGATAGGAGVRPFMPPLVAHPAFAGLSLPPPVRLPLGHLLFSVVCLAQRGEERYFASKIQLFWHGVLDRAIPHSGTAGAPA